MLSNKKPLENPSLYKNLSKNDAETISGGVTVGTQNSIERGRATIFVNLREVLVAGGTAGGRYTRCDGQFDDFTGDLTVTCRGLQVNGGPVSSGPFNPVNTLLGGFDPNSSLAIGEEEM